jgi:diaminopimelate epimerase
LRVLGSNVRSIPFWKYQAIGNDFPLFHAPDLDDLDLSKIAINASDRKFGIGGDGILVMRNLDGSQVELRMFNPDGTEDFCGNGLRIAALHAYRQGWADGEFSILHGSRNVRAAIHTDGSISTTIGRANYEPEMVPHDRVAELFDDEIAELEGVAFRGSALTTGSTHTVIPVRELPTDEEIARWGPAIENLPMFPSRTSVIFAKESEFPNDLQIRIWERGVGETMGCGTGSSAAAADYLRRRSAGGLVLVRNPGGDVTIEMARWDAPITVTGTAKLVYNGRYTFTD